MRILFVTYRESLHRGASLGVMQTQVLEVLSTIAKDSEVRWLVLGQDFDASHSIEVSSGIIISYRNIGSAQRWGDRVRARQQLRTEIHEFVPDLIHLRGYHAALIASTLRINVPRVFDPRTLFPLERALIASGVFSAIKNRAWRPVERWIASRSNFTVAVSEPMRDYFLKFLRDDQVVWIPLAADHRRFIEPRSRRNIIRTEMGYNTDDIVIIYSGSISYASPDAVSSMLGRIRTGTPESKLLFVTRDESAELQRSLATKSIDATFRSAEMVEMPDLLCAADWGLIFTGLQDSPTEAERRLSRTVLGTKVPEYWAAGLGIIVARNLEWLAQLVSDNGLGVAVDGCDNPIKLPKRYSEDRHRSIAFHLSRFDTSAVVEQYRHLYRILLMDGQ